jgi:hypothetical protein
MTDEEVAEMIEELVEDGFFIRREGNLYFSEKAEFLHPEIYRVLLEEHVRDVGEDVWKLFNDGLLNIAGTNEDGEFVFELTEQAIQSIENQ